LKEGERERERAMVMSENERDETRHNQAERRKSKRD